MLGEDRDRFQKVLLVDVVIAVIRGMVRSCLILTEQAVAEVFLDDDQKAVVVVKKLRLHVGIDRLSYVYLKLATDLCLLYLTQVRT